MRADDDDRLLLQLQFMTKPAGRRSAANPPLLSTNIRGERLPPARSSISISFSPPVMSLLGNRRKSRAGLTLEEHLLHEYGNVFYSDRAALLKRREWLVCFFFFDCFLHLFVGGLRQERAIQREQVCSFEAFHHHLPNSCSSPPSPHPPPPLGQCAREKERQWESERVTLTSQWRGDVKRRIHAGGKKRKKILLSLLPPLFTHPTASGEQRRSPAGVFPHSAFPPFLRLYQTVGGERGEPPPRARPLTLLLSRRRVPARSRDA